MMQGPPRPFVYDPPLMPRLSVLHRDDDLLVLDKPSGLLSAPGKTSELADCLDARAKAEFDSATMVHRLDCDTSGVIVFALNGAAHRHIGLQFERRKLHKHYVARVWGHIDDDAGHVDAAMRCDWPNRPRQMIDPAEGRPAQTDWQVLAREMLDGIGTEGVAVTRVKLTPKTGRSHQLRVHMASLGHPILGDNIYAPDAALAAAPRLQLHAESLTLFHPNGGQSCTFTAPCPF